MEAAAVWGDQNELLSVLFRGPTELSLENNLKNVRNRPGVWRGPLYR